MTTTEEHVCEQCEYFIAIFGKVDELLCDDTFSKSNKFDLALHIFKEIT